MAYLIEDKEVKITGIEVLSPALGEVVRALDEGMPSESSAVVEITSISASPNDLVRHLGNARLVSRVLQQSPELRDRFPSTRRLVFTSPNTWLVGVFESDNLPISKHGLFSRLDSVYYPEYVRRSLKVDASTRVGHKGLDLEQLTGRKLGTVSVVLEEMHLKRCSVIDFDPGLIQDLNIPYKMVDYPLGDGRFYVARGETFLPSYAALLRNFGISSNLV